MITTYHIAHMENGKMFFFQGFAPGGALVVGEVDGALTFVTENTAMRMCEEMNDKQKRHGVDKWFTVQFTENDK